MTWLKSSCTFSRVLVNCRPSTLLLNLSCSTSMFSKVRRPLWCSWIRSYMQFSTATTFNSELLPNSVQTVGRPRDDTSYKSKSKERKKIWSTRSVSIIKHATCLKQHIKTCELQKSTCIYRSTNVLITLHRNVWRYSLDWCVIDILARCALCRRYCACRNSCAVPAMIGWTASRGLFYIQQSCGECPWLGKKCLLNACSP